MIRKIITIDEEKCDGCGLCVDACHEGAIVVKNGKAALLKDDYCDGLGDCLPACPSAAITFEEREAAPYDEEAVKARMAEKSRQLPSQPLSPRPCGCPGANARAIVRSNDPEAAEPRPAKPRPAKPCPAEEVRPLSPLPCGCPGSNSRTIERDAMPGPEDAPAKEGKVRSRLNQWPVQIRLVPVNAPYFEGADLLIAADCAAYAHGNFHNEFIRGRITLIGCPKLDSEDYAEKLSAIIKNNNVKTVTLARMEVPCCGGLSRAVRTALMRSGKDLPLREAVISTDGGVLEA